MNYLDIAIAVPLLYGLVKGFSNGLIKEITGLLSLIIGIYIAVNFSILLEPYLSGIFGYYEQFKPIIAFTVLFVATSLIIKLIGILANKLTKALALGIVSRFLGGIFGLLKIAAIFSFLLFVIADYNLINKNTKDDSVLYKPLSDIAALITPQLKKPKLILDKIDEATEKAKEKINQQINSE